MSAPTEQNSTPRPPARVPIDFEAILAGMQDQIDDLTSVVEAHRRRFDALDEKARKG